MKFLPSCSVVLLVLSFQFVSAAPDSSRAMTPAEAAKFESIRRQDTLLAAKQALMDADRLLIDKNYTEADKRYQFALDNATNAGISQVVYQRSAAGLAAAKSGEADQAAQTHDFAQAATLIRQAINLQPDNPAYAKQLQDLKTAQLAYQADVRDPEGTTVNPAVTPEFKDRVATVQKLLFQGDRYLETGQYTMAETTYSKILLLDPYNKAARNKMAKMERYEYRADEEHRKLAKQQNMNEVASQWENKISPSLVVPLRDATISSAPTNIAKINQKLNSIIIDKINFDKIDIQQVVDYLIDKSRELDPEHIGVNFVLRLTQTLPPPTTPTPGTPPAAGAPTDTTTPAPAPAQNTINRLVTIDLTNQPLAQVLQFLSEETNLQVTVDDYAVDLHPSVDEGEVLSVRTFLAPPSLFQDNTTQLTPSGGAGTLSSYVKDVTASLKNQGVQFPQGATATYLPNSSKLVIRDTPDMLDLVASLIDQSSKPEPQVQITAKVAEFTETALKAFTANALVNFGFISNMPTFTTGPVPLGGNAQASTALRGPFQQNGTAGVPGALQNDQIDALVQGNQVNNGIAPSTNPLNGADFSTNPPSSLFLGAVLSGRGLGILLNLLSDRTGVDLLSAPSVTTQSGLKAFIDISQEFIYPSVFAAPELNTQPFALNIGGFFGNFNGLNNVNANLVDVTLGLPPTPSEFKKQDVGVTLEVKPTTYPDQRIDLDITRAQVLDFDGFINYGVPIVSIENTGQMTPSVLSPGIVNQPVFNLRSITTRLQVLDGQTAVLGGLVREDTQEVNDKVPGLGDLPLVGRLFQSKVSDRIKRNLVFFITANLVRPDGTPQYMKTINAPQEEKSAPLNLGDPLNLPPVTSEGGS